MNQPPSAGKDFILNLVGVPCREKHAIIFERWSRLPLGGDFVLVNDHDPVPLYHQFAARHPGAFEWTYLVAGPDEYQIKIRRVSVAPSAPVITPPPDAGECGTGEARSGELDLRGLPPPEPMVRILAAFERMSRGGQLRAITERRPIFLFPELEARGAKFTSKERDDGAWVTGIVRV